ncbi:MAG: tyrosine-protein phosphatase [Planctomycetes bacterium]|nr:tyrosine-protein phosphatase [Planctomycetota bacterium]
MSPSPCPRRLGLVTLLVLAFGGPVAADELALVGQHVLTGQVGGRIFEGWLEVRADATYAGERRFDDGALEPLAGRVAVHERALVLTPTVGLRGALMGASSASRSYVRDDDRRVVRWRFERGDEVEVIRQPSKDETRLGFVRRLLRRPVLRWVFKDNLGTVDARPGAEVLRSRQPSPADLVRLQERRGVRTIVSLNGDLDERATHWEDAGPGQSPEGRRVVLREFIAERGLAHEVFHLSASRAPTDAELVAIFRVLLDDSKKPLLLHCRGGSDRTGIISALYEVEFLGASKEEARARMRRHLWMAADGTEVQGAYLDLYQPGTLRRLLAAAGVDLPARFRE